MVELVIGKTYRIKSKEEILKIDKSSEHIRFGTNLSMYKQCGKLVKLTRVKVESKITDIERHEVFFDLLHNSNYDTINHHAWSAQWLTEYKIKRNITNLYKEY